MLSEQEADAERFTRLIRKQESGTGPLRYSIELRRSAGAQAARTVTSVRVHPKTRQLCGARCISATQDPRCCFSSRSVDSLPSKGAFTLDSQESLYVAVVKCFGDADAPYPVQ